MVWKEQQQRRKRSLAKGRQSRGMEARLGTNEYTHVHHVQVAIVSDKDSPFESSPTDVVLAVRFASASVVSMTGQWAKKILLYGKWIGRGYGEYFYRPCRFVCTQSAWPSMQDPRAKPINTKRS